MFLGANPAALDLILSAFFIVYVYNERKNLGAHWILFLMCVLLAASETITWVSPTPKHWTVLHLLVNCRMHPKIYEAPIHQCQGLYRNSIWDQIWYNESKEAIRSIHSISSSLPSSYYCCPFPSSCNSVLFGFPASALVPLNLSYLLCNDLFKPKMWSCLLLA